MASLFTRNGTYYAEFYDTTRNPKAKRFSLRTRRKTEARQRIVQLERDWERGSFDPWLDNPRTYQQSPKSSRSITLESALSLFLDDKKRQGRSPRTIEAYTTFCGGLIRSAGTSRLLSSLSISEVEAYVQDKNISQASRRTRYCHIKVWLNWCEQKGFARKSVIDSVAPPPRAVKIPKAVRQDDLRAIEAAICLDYREKLNSGVVKEGELIWMIPLFWFGLYSGLRASELARLRWKHIDFEKHLIHIYEQKNGKEQTVPLAAPARRILQNILSEDSEAYVFLPPGSDPYYRNIKSFRCNFARKFKRYCKAAGIKRRITPHGLRHGFCTILAEAGKSAPIIKEAARHADISTSMRYVHIANEKLKAELDDVFA